MNILITGAGGFLGTELIRQLKETTHTVFALSSDTRKITTMFGKQVAVFNIEQWQNGILPMEKIDVVINCAFTRTSKGSELAKSLRFSKDIFSSALQFNCNVINISSRSVYGENLDIPWSEHTTVHPNSLYALAKYSSELLLESIYRSKQHLKFTNIRLAGLLSPIFDDRLINKFIDKFIKGVPLDVIGGNQQFAFLDIRDAASGIISLLNKDNNDWKTCYNFGSTITYSLMEVIKEVELVSEKLKIPKVEINLKKDDKILLAEMNSSLFYKDTGWKPRFNLEATINDIFKYKLHEYNEKK